MIEACLCTTNCQKAPDVVDIVIKFCFARMKLCKIGQFMLSCLGAPQIRRRNMMLPEWNFSPLVKQTSLGWYWEENVKSTALPFSACCSFTCYLIGTIEKGGSRVSFTVQWNISHSACSMSEWFCLGLSCAGSWGGGPSAYPSLGFGAGMVSLTRSSSHSPWRI